MSWSSAGIEMRNASALEMIAEFIRLLFGKECEESVNCHRSGQEIPHRLEERFQPVVIYPVARAVHAKYARVAEIAGATVLRRILRPAFAAVDQQCRAGKARPQIGD